jgi:hypothetical protein
MVGQRVRKDGGDAETGVPHGGGCVRGAEVNKEDTKKEQKRYEGPEAVHHGRVEESGMEAIANA